MKTAKAGKLGFAAMLGYLIGTFPTADIVSRGLAKRNGTKADLRDEGTGNPGALNAAKRGRRSLFPGLERVPRRKGCRCQCRDSGRVLSGVHADRCRFSGGNFGVFKGPSRTRHVRRVSGVYGVVSALVEDAAREPLGAATLGLAAGLRRSDQRSDLLPFLVGRR
jgi:hypothetical protein